MKYVGCALKHNAEQHENQKSGEYVAFHNDDVVVADVLSKYM